MGRGFLIGSAEGLNNRSVDRLDHPFSSLSVDFLILYSNGSLFGLLA
jgi:hypothetical protein